MKKRKGSAFSYKSVNEPEGKESDLDERTGWVTAELAHSYCIITDHHLLPFSNQLSMEG